MTTDLLISRRAALKGSLALTLTSALPAMAASKGLSAVVDAGKRGHPISEYMYGGFIEHIANLINYSDQPKVNTGSDPWPLDVSAALTDDRQALIVAVVNASGETHTLHLEVQGFRKAARGRCGKLVAPGLDAQNIVGEQPQVAIRQTSFDPAARGITAAPASIVLYEFAVG